MAPLDLSSPQATYMSFLSKARQVEVSYLAYRSDQSATGAAAVLERLGRTAQSLDLSQIPVAQRNEVAVLRVAQLFDVLVRLPKLDPSEIPGETEDLPDVWAIPDTEIQIARAEGTREPPTYLFSASTVARLPEFHARIIDYPPTQPTAYPNWTRVVMAFTGPMIPNELAENLPAVLKSPFLGTQVWKALLTVLIWALIGALACGWALFIRRGQDESRTAVARLVRQISVPMMFAFLVWLAHLFAIYQSSLAGLFANIEIILTTIALYIAFALIAFLATRLVAELIIALPFIPDRRYDTHLLHLVSHVGGIAAACAILVIGADRIGVPAFGLLAGLGVGGVALALAAQSTVENVLGGISIFADRPFRIGDFIQYGTSTGTVELIGPRSSRIRGLDGTLTTVPNADLAKMHIVNYSARDKCLLIQSVGLRYETTQLQLEWILATIARRFAAHEMVEEVPGMPRVRLLAFGPSSIDIEVRAHVLTSDYGMFLGVQEELLFLLRTIIEEGGSGFAYPSQTIYLGRDHGLDSEATARAESAALEARGRREISDVPSA
ncbi:mechanosensitive ion channel family protein [Roseovarius sp. MMSF_3281]|uniref:mechanosensitive ion channel family protein n=1 Tax=Roseovarius sp. MMSF_3281 TaxID=3046694 RepID=UPI00273F21B8|nr:mechanosensitive ion channel family protein [Roseovarius sp. MMSF_3281]